jgi:hypothetical protein
MWAEPQEQSMAFANGSTIIYMAGLPLSTTTWPRRAIYCGMDTNINILLCKMRAYELY